MCRQGYPRPAPRCDQSDSSNQLRQCSSLQVDRFKRQFKAVPGDRLRLLRALRPVSSQSFIVQSLRGISKLKRSFISFALQQQRSNAGRVNGDHGGGGSRSQAMQKQAGWSRWQVFRQHHTGSIRQQFQTVFANPVLFEVKRIRQASFSHLSLHITCSLQNKHVMAVGSEWICFRQSVVDQQRFLQSGSQQAGGIQRRVLVRADGGAHPVQHEFGGRDRGAWNDAAAAFSQMRRQLAEPCGRGGRSLHRRLRLRAG